MSEEVISSNFIHDIIDEDLKEGVVDSIHTRFPPEPNGYLHIGSAKAIYINWSTAKKYGGKFNLRYDDTNPTKEDTEYVESIYEDLKWLGAEPSGGIFYGSDYFDKCYEYAIQLIKDGKAYDEEYRPVTRSLLTGVETQVGEILLGGAERVYCFGEVDGDTAAFLRKYYGEKAIFC